MQENIAAQAEELHQLVSRQWHKPVVLKLVWGPPNFEIENFLLHLIKYFQNMVLW